MVSANGLLDRGEAIGLEKFCELLLDVGHSAGAPIHKKGVHLPGERYMRGGGGL